MKMIKRPIEVDCWQVTNPMPELPRIGNHTIPIMFTTDDEGFVAKWPFYQLKGNVGDYIAFDVKGNPYVIHKDVFEQTYVSVDKAVEIFKDMIDDAANQFARGSLGQSIENHLAEKATEFGAEAQRLFEKIIAMRTPSAPADIKQSLMDAFVPFIDVLMRKAYCEQMREQFANEWFIKS